jgi:electron transport complex protein RnfD
MAFTVSPPPHIKEGVSVKALMWGRFIVLLPLCLASIYLFGFPALGILISGVLGAVFIELAIQKTFHQKVTIGDGNAAYMGLLIALIVPPSVPIWLPFIGAVFGVGVVKHAFGGLGSYMFHPALATWVFLSLSWASLMVPSSIPQLGSLSDLVLESGAGFLADASPIAMIGVLFLIAKKYVDWKIPLAYFLTTAILVVLLGDPLSYIITGSFLLGVFFIATETSTSPITKNGRFAYGAACGFLTVIYGYFTGDYISGMLYGLLLSNAIAPLIERSTIPKPFAAPVITHSTAPKAAGGEEE